MLIHNNYSENFIAYFCTNNCEIGSTFRNSEKITESSKIGMNELFLMYGLLIIFGSILLEHLNITKPILLKK